MADKIKWIYLKDNPYKIEALAFLDYDMPDKIKEFLDRYANKEKVFESILLNIMLFACLCDAYIFDNVVMVSVPMY